MKKQKYHEIIIVAILGILIYPSNTFALWWNPSTWFKRGIETKQFINTVQSTNIQQPKKLLDEKVEKITTSQKQKSTKTIKQVFTNINTTPPLLFPQ